jgi:D-inositol-3-phosphate glycosyltransferase
VDEFDSNSFPGASFDVGRSMNVESLAVLSMHTSPLAQPGVGDGGGMNVYVRELAVGLAHQGTNCDIYVRRNAPGLPDLVEIEPGVRVRHVEAGPLDLEKEALPKVVGEFTDAVEAAIRDNPVDALHAHYWLSGVAGHELKHRLDLPLGVTFHTLGRVKASNGDQEPVSRFEAEDQILGCADVVFASGSVEASQLQRLYHVPAERIEQLTPGVDLAFFAPGQRWAARQAIGLGDQPVLLFVGRIQPLKGVDIAVEALARIENENAVLAIVGGPSGQEGAGTLAALQARIDELGIRDRVRFFDPQPHHLLSTFYRAADLCLVPSRSESFGLVALEAAACGTPVVASDVGGLRNNVVDGVTGLLVADRTPENFAAGINAVLDDPLLALRLGEAGAARARQHTWDASAARAAEVFGRVRGRELVDCA